MPPLPLPAAPPVDVPALLAGGALSSESPGIVVVRGIALATVCPHHLLPSVGTATVAYLPGKRLLGLGTIAALVEAFARRLALQEDIGHNVVTALMEHAGARGAYCRIELSHACLNARSRTCGQASVVTTAQAGELDLAALSLALEEPR